MLLTGRFFFKQVVVFINMLYVDVALIIVVC